ncbi:unnamed protein product [Citrullus colocynthis]|uniref:Uncharacterized protein n=1 Tax=Citrullus colocynthis TaxID=252529 RepID=A0ABP0Z4S5_9ROSI
MWKKPIRLDSLVVDNPSSNVLEAVERYTFRYPCKSASPHHTQYLTTCDVMSGPFIDDDTIGSASPQPNTHMIECTKMVGGPSFGGSTSPHPNTYPTTCTKVGGPSHRWSCNDFGHFIGNTTRQMEAQQQTEAVVECGPSMRQKEAGPSMRTTRTGDIIMQLVPASVSRYCLSASDIISAEMSTTYIEVQAYEKESSESSEGEGSLEEDHVQHEVPFEEATSLQCEHEVPLKEATYRHAEERGNAKGGTRSHVLEPVASTQGKMVWGQDYLQLFDEWVSRLETTLEEVKSNWEM